MDLRNYQAILFDFDYTLANSERGILKCFKLTLERAGYPLPADDTIKRTIGMPMADALKLLTGVTDDEVIAQLKALYITFADEYMTPNTVLFPDTKTTLQQLHQSGKHLAIISTKTAHRIRQTLERDGLTDIIDFVIGSEDVKTFKPSPEGILVALQRLGLKPEQAVYVGDNTIDAEAAQNAGTAFAAVLTGNNTREEFSNYPHIAIMQSLSELVK